MGYCCQTPVLGLGLGVDFTFLYNKKNKKNKKIPHLIFHRRAGTTWNMKFGTKLSLLYGLNFPRDICPCDICPGTKNVYWGSDTWHRGAV